MVKYITCPKNSEHDFFQDIETGISYYHFIDENVDETKLRCMGITALNPWYKSSCGAQIPKKKAPCRDGHNWELVFKGEQCPTCKLVANRQRS